MKNEFKLSKKCIKFLIYFIPMNNLNTPILSYIGPKVHIFDEQTNRKKNK